MAGESKTTTNHHEIRKWAEARGGHPATVRRTGDQDEPGVLRIDFPGYSGEQSLEAITWDAFFEKFEESRLAFVYQDETADGKPSRFCKLVSRETTSGRKSSAGSR
ncbi:MAG: lipocalin/fatty-acid binding family protein [Blastocatellia bacterium]